MGSKYPPRFYDDAKLTVLEQAFGEVWKTVHLMDDLLESDRVDDDKLRQEITEHLLHFFDLGVREPGDLSARTMEVISK